jgi:DegV family protein with EDD domain
MRPRYHFVTDSSARFSRSLELRRFPLTVLPNTVHLENRIIREDVDMTGEELMRLISQQGAPPRVVPPSRADYAAVFARLASVSDGIISLHPSREINASWQNARDAASQLSGTCPITVIDTRTICAAQGMLVRLGLRAAEQALPYADIVNAIRGAVERVYSLYCVETLEYLRQNGIMGESRALLGAILGIKPLVSVEEGRLVVTEKVRTRAQVTDQLVEFLKEFEALEDVLIVQAQAGMSDQTRSVQDRLSMEFVGRHFAHTLTCAALASLLGTDLTGVVILESEMDYYDDDFSED